MSSTGSTPSLASGSWTLDPANSRVEFRARTFWGLAPVKGFFTEYGGRLDLSAGPAVELTIAAASLDTANGKRDTHLRSADFFDAEKHPRVTFTASEVSVHDDHLHVRGTLTAAGQQLEIEPQVSVRQVDGALELEATATVNHRELGMTYTKGGMIRPMSQLIVSGRLIPAPS